MPILLFWGLLCGSVGKESTCNVGDLGSVSGLGKFNPGIFRYIIRLKNMAAAAAAAKSLQSCPTPCDPMDGSPSGYPVPRILQARTLEWVAISFSNA